MSYDKTGKNNPFFGKHHTEETKEKIRKHHKGIPLSEEHKKKIGQGLFKGTIEDRFLSKVKKTSTCWIWTGFIKKGKMPYGRFSLEHRKPVIAHRYSYEIYNGDIPKGMCVCHSCDNPSCVNPKHLWLGTTKQNIQDCLKKGRGNRAKGEKNGTSKLNKKQVDKIRKMFSSGKYMQKELGVKFSVSKGLISQIVLNKIWKKYA